MSLINNLEKSIMEQQTGEDRSVVVLYAPDYPAQFCSHLLERMKQRGQAVARVDCASLDPAAVMAEWSMSFLGTGQLYWCGDMSAVESSKKKQLFSFLAMYRGPHRVMLFNDKSIEGLASVALPTFVDRAEFGALVHLFYPHVENDQELIEAVFAAQPKLAIEAACVALQYLAVLGEGDTNVGARSLFGRMLAPEHSIFTLSQHFFAKELVPFFKLWRALEVDFAPEFWVSFWSEQLWQASLFVSQAKEVGPLAARKGVNRLPFAFMQRDWKRYNEREFSLAHNDLYLVDFGMKNGYAKDGLELFLWRFLQGYFGRK